MRRNGPFALLFHALFMAFMLAPLVIVLLVAFTPDGYLSLPLHGPSLRWFRAIGDNPEFITSFWVSVRLGLASATLASVACCRRRWRSGGRGSAGAGRSCLRHVAADGAGGGAGRGAAAVPDDAGH